ncbi:MAG: LPS assembly protein LptD, partial [Gammaproteobacteria bacterium]|nr:LPS assembly protein LptD [Gammaproteobacteria bacterium]
MLRACLALARLHPPLLRPLLALSLMVSGVSSVQAMTAVAAAGDAARIDWRPRSELPPAQQTGMPAFCSGGYLAPPVAPVPPVATGTEPPVEASGLRARYELDTRLTLEGDIRVRQGLFEVRGERAEYDQLAGRIRLDGQVATRGPGFLLVGESAEYRVGAGELSLNTASFLVHEADMRGRASRIVRTAQDEVIIRNGLMTTCSPDRNDWSLVAAEVNLDRDAGFGTATHVRLQVKDVPVFYFPWFSFPIDDRRKSGFLYPSFGTSNTGQGLNVAVPYYFNLAPHYDLTYTPEYIHGRGLLNQFEGRYLSRFGQSELDVGHILKDDYYATRFPGKGGERWALGFRNQSLWGGGWDSMVDYAVVSDGDYLSDLNRSLDISQQTHLSRQALTRYQRGESVYFEALLYGYQTLDDKILESEKPYAQLPELNLMLMERSGLWMHRLDSQYVYFYRDNTLLDGADRVIGSRLRVIPESGLESRRRWGFWRASALMDHTQYLVDDYTQRDENHLTRSVPFVQADAGLFFDRSLELAGDAYNQSLEPRLYYVWSPA